MTGSYRSINYSVRPAKYAERRMLAEIFRRLEPFAPVTEYAYVGFGSPWFSDFSLYHRLFGIRKMISFEREAHDRDRFEANKPFQMRVDYRNASEALLDLDWTQRQFIWLDYDDAISTEILRDVRTVANQATSGTVLVVSVSSVKAAEFNSEEESPSGIDIVERFKQEFGSSRVPAVLSELHLRGWLFGQLSMNMIQDEIRDGLVARNSQTSNLMSYEPICRIQYADNAKMATLAGIFFAENEREKYIACRFESLDFAADPNEPIRIEVPLLTIREIRELERQLPIAPSEHLLLGSIPESDAKKFVRMYRYFPNFSVVES